MPRIKLSKSECKRDMLPPVCVICGDRAVVRRERQFNWFPGWIWIIVILSWLIGLILMVVMTKSRRVRLPVCDEHEGYFRRRNLIVSGGTAAVLALCAVLLVALIAQPEQDKDAMAVPLCGGGAAVFFAWIVAVAVVIGRGVRATEITDRSITLGGVHEAFIEELEADRERDWDEYEAEQRELREIARERRARRQALEDRDDPDHGPRKPSRRDQDDLDRRAEDGR